MSVRLRWAAAAAAVVALAIGSPATGALDWHGGVRGADISVCFAGDAVTSRPDRVAQIRDYLREFSWAANIELHGLGACAPPSVEANGNDRYAEDIRVVIPGTSASFTGPVPGTGCPMFRDANGNYNHGNDGGGSWSGSPNDALTTTACLYNLKLNDDAGPSGVPYLNHTLHEFGHALGLAHEHERTDVDTTICSAPGFGGGASTGFITPYDRFSVMHYQFPTCGIDGNYGYSGLSELDQLALHIMYPEDDRRAEVVGTTVIRQGRALRLTSAWLARGANVDYAAPGFSWRLGNLLLSTQPSLSLPLQSPGVYPIRLDHGDFLGRAYSATIMVTVLTPRRYDATIVGGRTATSALTG